MRVTFDLTPAVHHHAGAGRYAQELLVALTSLDPANEYRALYIAPRGGERPDAPLDHLPAQVIRLSAKLWRLSVMLASFAGAAMDEWLPPTDLFHATDHLLPPLRRARTVFTVLDLTFRLFPEYHLPLNRWYSTLMLPRFLRQADAIITISEHTRRDLLKWVSLPPDKVRPIHLGVNRAFRLIEDISELARVRAKYHLPERFILYLGTLEPRKNLTTLITAYHALLTQGDEPPALVLAGRKGWLYEPILNQVRATGLSDRVLFTDWVDEQDAPAILNAADLFVYPSLYEGFGLPPLEAMACGTPIITSNVSSLPEVIGDAGIMIEPHDTRALTQAMRWLLADKAKRTELRSKGLQQASHFSWERTAQETLDVYRQATEQRPNERRP